MNTRQGIRGDGSGRRPYCLSVYVGDVHPRDTLGQELNRRKVRVHSGQSLVMGQLARASRRPATNVLLRSLTENPARFLHSLPRIKESIPNTINLIEELLSRYYVVVVKN